MDGLHHHQQQQQQSLLVFPALSRPPWQPSQHQQQPTHPPPPMQQQQHHHHHHHHLLLNTSLRPTNQATNRSPGGSWLPAAGNRWRQHKLRFRLEAAAEVRARRRGKTEKRCDDGRCIHMMGWEQQLWAHTSMVVVGTSNHSDAVMRSLAVTTIAIIAVDRTAAITRRPTPAPIWREADIAHVSRSDEQVSNEAREAVEPTTMTMTMTSDEAADVWLHCG
ncbi:hypothetical protein PTSG_12631 [Salpingoeca rosetta]|uniref:Uncharacterized protein n=1 Tax=Salpingoeca rosetta (strain ATCC 50818 / BSB-021) TaxID=946362 RepID=F2UHP5_SALR5|nr:uncharacterized protein PTSG_12631 [Salpingoeca rosetta]EGD76644.1 hypothetical protein PTSG_12631 [Salpingoeca rosetta]|eukprot:XP_004991558.1 hypothetical protein PTSG_12631 [Salpingoeca rosetta]